MSKVFSTRLDEAVLDQLDHVTKRLRMTKKQFLEEAIRLRAAGVERAGAPDVWSQSCGAWRRREAPATTIRRARRAFQVAMRRHHRRRGPSGR